MHLNYEPPKSVDEVCVRVWGGGGGALNYETLNSATKYALNRKINCTPLLGYIEEARVGGT